MVAGEVAVLDEPARPISQLSFKERHTWMAGWPWEALLGAAKGLGVALRWIFVTTRVAVVAALLIAGVVVVWSESEVFGASTEVAAGILGGTGLAFFALTVWIQARRSLLVGDFTAIPLMDKDKTVRNVDLANLLQVELSRLGRLLAVVENRRAVPSGIGAGNTLDATLSVDDLIGTLQGATSAETKISVGPVSVPVEPLIALAGRAVRAPRLTGSLHRDGGTLILTAQEHQRGGLTWRVTGQDIASSEPENEDGDRSETESQTAQLSALVSELALRIFTDVSLGREVRWEATDEFVRGVRRFRACLRTPKDRKVNLKKTEHAFLSALSEDEDFPLAYFNLGVVYTELQSLAQAAGRKREEDMHMSAAETAFSRAIEKDPQRWESYIALGHTQLSRGQSTAVIDLCNRVLELKPDGSARARAYELQARALLARAKAREAEGAPPAIGDPAIPGDIALAVQSARRATTKALRALLRAYIVRRRRPKDVEDRVPNLEELVGACAATFASSYYRRVPQRDRSAESSSQAGQGRRMVRRADRLVKRARKMTTNAAEVRFEFGLRALSRGWFKEAQEHLRAAAHTEPSRPSYLAALALAQTRSMPDDASESDKQAIRAHCDTALKALAGAYFPARDADACELLARVYERLPNGDSPVRQKPEQLRTVASHVEGALATANSETSVSAVFFNALRTLDRGQARESPQASGTDHSRELGRSLESGQAPGHDEWTDALGAYGAATRDAHAELARARTHSPGGKGFALDDKARAIALRALREALQHAEKATSLNPLSSLAWETLGDVHRELSDYRNARTAWKYALGRDPDNPDLYDKIGSSHWHLAFQDEHRPIVPQELERAAEFFDQALLLYGSGSFDEQVRTHYRLGKLHVALGSFSRALPHLQVVEAVSESPPLVGWLLLGLAQLGRRNYAECEYEFRRVIARGEELAERLEPGTIVGFAVDERSWPLGLTRAWGHLGMAFSYVERDGSLQKARDHVKNARQCSSALPAKADLFPTRISAACSDCEGAILYKKRELVRAIKKLEGSVADFPYSRSYLNLALAYEQRAARDANGEGTADLQAAKRLLRHAVNLRPGDEPPGTDIAEAMARLEHGA